MKQTRELRLGMRKVLVRKEGLSEGPDRLLSPASFFFMPQTQDMVWFQPQKLSCSGFFISCTILPFLRKKIIATILVNSEIFNMEPNGEKMDDHLIFGSTFNFGKFFDFCFKTKGKSNIGRIPSFIHHPSSVDRPFKIDNQKTRLLFYIKAEATVLIALLTIFTVTPKRTPHAPSVF